jgi:Uma2 family endonuclease
MPLEEFLEESNRQPFELINGERKPKLPTFPRHNVTIRLLFRLLDTFCQSSGEAEIFSEMTFVLPDSTDSNWVTGSRTPDLMVYLTNRLSEYQAANPDWLDHPFALVPDLVIEVISANDLYSDVDEKVLAYLSDGVRRIILVDPQRQKVIIHAPHKEAVHLSGDAVLDGGEVLPAFQLPLAKLFE